MRTSRLIFLGCSLMLILSSFQLRQYTPDRSGQRNSITSWSGVVSFVHFMAHRQKTGAALSWIVSDPNAVDGFLIRRSYDGITFYTIDEVQTVNANWNRYFDPSVFPGYVWYEVIAVLQDGTEVSSGIEQVRIVSKK